MEKYWSDLVVVLEWSWRDPGVVVKWSWENLSVSWGGLGVARKVLTRFRGLFLSGSGVVLGWSWCCVLNGPRELLERTWTSPVVVFE